MTPRIGVETTASQVSKSLMFHHHVKKILIFQITQENIFPNMKLFTFSHFAFRIDSPKNHFGDERPGDRFVLLAHIAISFSQKFMLYLC